MKAAHFFWILSLFFGIALETKGQAQESPNARLQDISQRALNDNQPQALAEAVTLPSNLSLPFLSQYMWIYRDEKNAYYDTARKTIIEIPNYDRYFADKLAAASRAGGVDNDTFELLSLLGTPQAEAVVAPYLFDFKMTPGNGHIRSEVNALSAALALGRMNLDDAPTEAKPGSYTSKDIIAWQEWAVDKGLVPRSKKAEVPHWLIEIEAPAPPSAPISKPSPTPASSAQTSLLPQSPASSPKQVAKGDTPHSGFPILPLAILAALIVVTAVFLLRHSRRKS